MDSNNIAELDQTEGDWNNSKEVSLTINKNAKFKHNMTPQLNNKYDSFTGVRSGSIVSQTKVEKLNSGTSKMK